MSTNHRPQEVYSDDGGISPFSQHMSSPSDGSISEGYSPVNHYHYNGPNYQPQEVYSDDEGMSPSLQHMASPSDGSIFDGSSPVNHNHYTGPTFVGANIEKVVIYRCDGGKRSSSCQDDGPGECQLHFREEHSTNIKAVISATKRKAGDQKVISAGAPPDKNFKPSYQTHTFVTTMEVNADQGDKASTSSSTGQPENVNLRVEKKHGTAKKKCSPSTPAEFKEYAETAGIRPFRKSLKPHLIMKNIETFVYKNERENAISQMKLLLERMEYQSHPTSDQLRDLAKVASRRRSPLAVGLLLAASVFKNKLEDPHKISSEVSNPFQRAYILVRGLIKGGKDAENVLNYKLMSNGTHPHDIANFILELMGDMYNCDSSKILGVSSRKAFALQWIIAGLHKSGKYETAIKLAWVKKCDYEVIENDAVVNINRYIGLCCEACGKFDEALLALKKAKTMARAVGSEWCMSMLQCLESDIVKVESKLRRQSMPDLQRSGP